MLATRKHSSWIHTASFFPVRVHAGKPPPFPVHGGKPPPFPVHAGKPTLFPVHAGKPTPLPRKPPPVNRMTHRCKNITLPQTLFAGGNKQSYGWDWNPEMMGFLYCTVYCTHYTGDRESLYIIVPILVPVLVLVPCSVCKPLFQVKNHVFKLINF